MRGNCSKYHLETPASLAAALKILNAEKNQWTALAGGTDLMVVYEAGQLPPGKYLNIWNLAELRGIHTTAETVTIGALTTYTQIQEHQVLQKEFPNLCAAGLLTGGRAIQNRGTLAGNIANASPAADSPPALLVADAELELVSAAGSRWVAYDSFHLGYKKTLRRPEELIRTIRLRRPGKRSLRHYYRKVGTRKAQAISKVVMAATAELNGERLTSMRIAFGSVAPTTVRCLKLESYMVGKTRAQLDNKMLRSMLAAAVAPIDDIRSRGDFRAAVCGNLLEDFLAQL